MIRMILAVAGIFALAPLAHAQQPPPAVLFQNVRIFDGEASALSPPSNVLIRGNKIERISTTAIASDDGANTRIIDGGGRTLMPGLIDMHWHAILVRPTPAEAMAADAGYTNIVASAEASRHADARLHHGSRHGRAGLRAQARHRRRHRSRPTHLPDRRDDNRHQRSR